MLIAQAPKSLSCCSNPTPFLTIVYLFLSQFVFCQQTFASSEYQHKVTQFHEVKPRTRNAVHSDLEFNYSTDAQALHFQIKIIKPDDYVYRAQENDNIFENEHVRLYLVSDNNARNAYVFAINHQNAYFDGIYRENAELSLDWNGQWDYSVEVFADYWTVQGSIPWQNMSFQSDSEAQTIQLLVSKHGNNNQRILSSEPTYINYTGFFDNLRPLNIQTKQSSQLDIFPYYSLHHSLLDNSTQHNLGGEFFWQLSQNEYLDLSLNPDFGQVESNDLIVNFSAIESFFSEQRPFFTRNQNLFDVEGPENLRLVHTPRIGGASIYEDVDARDIIAAGRYNYTHGASSYSLLMATEGNQQDIAGRDFLVARAKFKSAVGIIGLSSNFVNTPSLERQSTVIGLDYAQSFSDELEISAGLITSSIKSLINTADYGLWLQGHFQQDDVHLHELNLFVYGENLDLNDVGFVKRVDRKQLEYEYTLLFPEFNSAGIEQLLFSIEVEAKTNFANETLPLQLGFTTEFTTKHEATVELGLEWLSAGKDDKLTRQFNSTQLDAGWQLELVIESPELPFGQIETEVIYGTENWSGDFYELAVAFKAELLAGIFSEIELSQYQSDSWLTWTGDNNVDEFKFAENAVDLKLNYRWADAHEFRIRLELVAGEAQGLSSNIIDDNGARTLVALPEDFTFSEAAMQFRYKYSITKLSAVFLSYTFGGEFEDENNTYSRQRLFSKAIANKNNHSLFFKTTFGF
jgi:hypothetical protein